MKGSPEGRVVVMAVRVAGDGTKFFLSVGVLVRGVLTVVVKCEIGRGWDGESVDASVGLGAAGEGFV